MAHTLGAFYSAGFYAGQRDASHDAAMAMLPPVIELLKPQSLVDIGCGVGTWLAAAESLGVPTVVGVEGPWVATSALRSPRIRLVTHDLERPLPLRERFDLAMSVEVAEHLTEGRADSLVRELCGLSDYVLFGAAIPGQGGVNHINEQWQSYWAQKFASHDYVALDLLRPNFWSVREIPVHYRQNTLLYVQRRALASLPAAAQATAAPWALDVVHPEVHSWNYADSLRPRTLSESLRVLAQLPAAVGRSLKTRLSGASAGGGASA